MEDADLQLQDLVPAEPLLLESGWPWWAWVLSGGVALMLVCIIMLIVRSGKASTAGGQSIDPQAAYRRALEEIQASSALPAREASVRLSGAIRLYLAAVCEDPSLYETHEETIARHDALDAFPQETRDQLSSVLTLLAKLKYDRPVDDAAQDVGEQSKTIVTQLHQQRPTA